MSTTSLIASNGKMEESRNEKEQDRERVTWIHTKNAWKSIVNVRAFEWIIEHGFNHHIDVVCIFFAHLTSCCFIPFHVCCCFLLLLLLDMHTHNARVSNYQNTWSNIDYNNINCVNRSANQKQPIHDHAVVMTSIKCLRIIESCVYQRRRKNW